MSLKYIQICTSNTLNEKCTYINIHYSFQQCQNMITCSSFSRQSLRPLATGELLEIAPQLAQLFVHLKKKKGYLSVNFSLAVTAPQVFVTYIFSFFSVPCFIIILCIFLKSAGLFYTNSPPSSSYLATIGPLLPLATPCASIENAKLYSVICSSDNNTNT